MNTQTYSKNIAKEFGGKVNYERLEAKLSRLLELKEFEILQHCKKHDEVPIKQVPKKPINKPEQVKQIKRDMYEIYVKRILKGNDSDYVKMTKIIDLALQIPGRHNMDVFIDCNSFSNFIDYADKYGIEYLGTHFYIPG